MCLVLAKLETIEEDLLSIACRVSDFMQGDEETAVCLASALPIEAFRCRQTIAVEETNTGILHAITMHGEADCSASEAIPALERLLGHYVVEEETAQQASLELTSLFQRVHELVIAAMEGNERFGEKIPLVTRYDREGFAIIEQGLPPDITSQLLEDYFEEKPGLPRWFEARSDADPKSIYLVGYHRVNSLVDAAGELSPAGKS